MNKIEDLIENNTVKILEAIDELVYMKDISYIDATVLWCEEHNVEIESVAPIIRRNGKFKGLIAEEAEKLNYLPKINRLPE